MLNRHRLRLRRVRQKPVRKHRSNRLRHLRRSSRRAGRIVKIIKPRCPSWGGFAVANSRGLEFQRDGCKRSLLECRLPLESRRVAPQIFQTVKRTFVAMKDVGDHLQIVEDDPLAGWESVDSDRAN